MSTRMLALFGLLVALAPTAAPSADPMPRAAPRRLLAQRGTRSCHTDADCSSLRVPPPRQCPHGGQMVATACCRMDYCGICWSDCPPGN